MRRQLLPALLMTVVLTVLTGLLYPLAVTAVAQVTMKHRANGSLVTRDGHAIGSSLIGQNFADPRYFHPRPSAAGQDGYDGLSSSASNLGPSNQKLLDAVTERVKAYREANGLAATDGVPVDAVTASGSGLDPHISVANADLQAARVARARAIPLSTVMSLVNRHTEPRQWGILGEKVVNVLELNLDLDRLR
jgi:K+-transporting ATPase ATPase C chain